MIDIDYLVLWQGWVERNSKSGSISNGSLLVNSIRPHKAGASLTSKQALAAILRPTSSASISISLENGRSTTISITLSMNQLATKAMPSLGNSAQSKAIGTNSII